jgi:hypothetical protein
MCRLKQKWPHDAPLKARSRGANISAANSPPTNIGAAANIGPATTIGPAPNIGLATNFSSATIAAFGSRRPAVMLVLVLVLVLVQSALVRWFKREEMLRPSVNSENVVVPRFKHVGQVVGLKQERLRSSTLVCCR